MEREVQLRGELEQIRVLALEKDYLQAASSSNEHYVQENPTARVTLRSYGM